MGKIAKIATAILPQSADNWTTEFIFWTEASILFEDWISTEVISLSLKHC